TRGGGGYDERPDGRIGCRKRPRRRIDGPLYISRLRVPPRERDAHQLPPAAHQPFAPRVRLRRNGIRARRLPPRRREPLPIFLLCRLHVDLVKWNFPYIHDARRTRTRIFAAARTGICRAELSLTRPAKGGN